MRRDWTRPGCQFIEVSHGDGLGGSSINYGRSRLTDEEMLRAASAAISRGSLTVLLIPGIGTQEDLEMALDCGAKAVRVATHVTEADIAEQHIGLAKKMGMTAFGFLMMVHRRPPEAIVEQAKLFESYGADAVYLADSAGAMLPEDVRARVDAVVNALSIPVGLSCTCQPGARRRKQSCGGRIRGLISGRNMPRNRSGRRECPARSARRSSAKSRL